MTSKPPLGRLSTAPAVDHLELLADPVRTALSADDGSLLEVAEIDPDAADTEELCRTYDAPLELSANCVVVAGRRGGEQRIAACVVLATTRADVNTTVRRRLDVRKASFLPMAEAVERTGMEYGGITPVGLPADWLLLIDRAVSELPQAVIGSGLRRSKLVAPGPWLATLPGAEVLDGLGRVPD